MKLPLSILILALAAGAADFEPPRLPNGKPNLNGVWQAISSAHYDVERHKARPAMQLREGPHGPLPDVPLLRLGAVASVPGGMGVVEGGKIPYTPEAAAKRKENQENWIERDPEIKCFMPGVPRATYMPFPFQIIQNEKSMFHRLRVRRGGARHLLQRTSAQPRSTPGWASRWRSGRETRW